MEKIYKRINWNTAACNGSADTDRYLHTQLARAVCKAAYETPLTVEEIGVRTGIPVLYIEDEIPRLEYGEAVCKIGNKYAANFIVFRLEDRKTVEKASEQMIKGLADRFERMFSSAAGDVDLQMKNGPFPPRRDGGYGWFIVEETVDSGEKPSEYTTGCNAAGGGGGNIYYYWTAKYFDNDIYHNGGTRWLCEKNIFPEKPDGIVKPALLSDEERAGVPVEFRLFYRKTICRVRFSVCHRG